MRSLRAEVTLIYLLSLMIRIIVNLLHLLSVWGANGTILPPILVVALQTLSEATFIDELPSDYVIACSETGYSNTDINNE